MIHARSRIAQMALAIVLAGAATLALAGLKDKPPEGLTLAGVEWQLDPYNSDNPSEAIERAAREAQRQKTAAANRPVFGDDDPFGRSSPTKDPIGSGRHTSGPLDRGSTTGGGEWGRGTTAADVDPIGNQTMSIQLGSAGRGSIFFESLRKNPQRVTFNQGQKSVTVSEDGLETECEAGTKEPFSDSFGDGKRECGWNGRAWVIETTRQQFRRSDRFELSKDGKTLKYTTTANEDGVGRVTISRRYQLPPNK